MTGPQQLHVLDMTRAIYISISILIEMTKLSLQSTFSITKYYHWKTGSVGTLYAKSNLFMWLPFETAFMQRNKWWAARPRLPDQALGILVVTQEEQMHERRSLQVHWDSWGSLSNKSCATILHPQTAQGELQMPDSKWDLLLQQVKGLRHFCTCKTAKLTCNITLLPGATRSAANVLIHKHLLQEKVTVQSQISLSILTQFKGNFRFSLEN